HREFVMHMLSSGGLRLCSSRLGSCLGFVVLATFFAAPVGAQPCVMCQPGDVDENEPDCGQPSDTANGGCTVPPRFPPIQCGQTVCGTGVWDPIWFALDNDFYAFTLTQPTDVTFSMTADFEPFMAFFGGSCPSLQQIDSTVGAGCMLATLSRCFPAGTF